MTGAIVYMATSRTTGKRYIGITNRDLARRISEHKYNAKLRKHNGHFYRAIRLRGIDDFTWEVMIEAGSKAEAMAHESVLVERLKPEYNSMPGGRGNGRVHSVETRRKIGEKSRGNKHRLGQTHSEETREKLRAAGLRDKEKWLKRSHLGPLAIRRAVICLDDGKIYESIREAASAYGVAKSALNELCRGQKFRKTVGGLRFAYAEVA